MSYEAEVTVADTQQQFTVTINEKNDLMELKSKIWSRTDQKYRNQKYWTTEITNPDEDELMGDDDLGEEFDCCEPDPIQVTVKFVSNAHSPSRDKHLARIPVKAKPVESIRRPPKPVDFRFDHTRFNSVDLIWKIEEDFKENPGMKQFFEVWDESKQCRVATCESTHVKILKLSAGAEYKFKVRTVWVAEHNGREIPSEWTTPVYVLTKRLSTDDLYQQTTSPTAPSNLQILELYPTSCVLRWNHDPISNPSDYFDYIYFIQETRQYDGMIVSKTFSNEIRLVNLAPNTEYEFLVCAKYYLPHMDQSLNEMKEVDERLLSPGSNPLKIITPSERQVQHKAIDCVENIQAQVDRDTHDIELTWEAPQSFHGRISYRIFNEGKNNQLKDLGEVRKLPLIIKQDLKQAEARSLSGLYKISVQVIVTTPRGQTLTSDYKDQDILILDPMDDAEWKQLTVRDVFHGKPQGMEPSVRVHRNMSYREFAEQLCKDLKIVSKRGVDVVSLLNLYVFDNSNQEAQGPYPISDDNTLRRMWAANLKDPTCVLMLRPPRPIVRGSVPSPTGFLVEFQQSDFAIQYECAFQALNPATFAPSGREETITVDADKLSFNLNTQAAACRFRVRANGRGNNVVSDWTQWATARRG